MVTIAQIFGYTIPVVFYVPHVPFALVIGLWILIKGIPDWQSKLEED